MNVHEETVKAVAKILGRSVEEIEKTVAEQEKRCKETVRLLSIMDVSEAIRDALFDTIGELAVYVGPKISQKVIQDLFFKQEGE